MKSTLAVTLGITLAATAAVGAQERANQPPPVGEEHTFDGLRYLVTEPEQTSDTPVPVLLFLHGGDRSNTRHHPLRHARAAGIESFPFLVIAPHCTGACRWSSVDFDGLLSEVAKEHSIDRKRVYLTGYSMGGYGAWSALAEYPEWFAAAAPIAGGGDSKTICGAKTVPVRAYHGDKDTVIPHSESVEMVEALEKCGGDAELITYEGGDHGAWLRAFRDPDFYTWLLAHQQN